MVNPMKFVQKTKLNILFADTIGANLMPIAMQLYHNI